MTQTCASSAEAFAVIRLRLTEPDLLRAYRAWGYPWTPFVFIAATLALTANLWIDQNGRIASDLKGRTLIVPAACARFRYPIRRLWAH